MRTKCRFLATVSLLVFPVVQAAAAQFADRSRDGKTLVVPAAHRSLGRVYHVLTDRDRQVYFESNAPLENIKGQSNKVVGYAVLDTGQPGSIVAGEWKLPVGSMKTGIDLRDEHIVGKDWLDAKQNPDIVFQIKETRDIKVIKTSDAFSSYEVTLVGDLTLHGVTRTISIPGSTITLMKESEATRKVARGDLMALRSKFTATLKDYNVSHPVIGEKVAKDVEIDVALYLSTTPPGTE